MKKKTVVIISLAVAVAVVAAMLVLTTVTTRDETVMADHPAVTNPEVSGRRVVERIELIEPKPAFDFHLVDQRNEVIRLGDFRDKLVLVGFIYTNCPDVCGVLTMHYRTIQRKFVDALEKDLVLVLITTDPKRDSPERVDAYTKGFQGRWYFLTGTEEQLKEVWDNYRVFVKEKADSDIVYHSYMVALVDREGMIRYRYVGLVDPEEVIIKDIQHLLQERS